MVRFSKPSLSSLLLSRWQSPALRPRSTCVLAASVSTQVLYKLWNAVCGSSASSRGGWDAFPFVCSLGTSAGTCLTLKVPPLGKWHHLLPKPKTLEPFQSQNPLCILSGSSHQCPLPSPQGGWLLLIQPCLDHGDSLQPTLCPGLHSLCLFPLFSPLPFYCPKSRILYLAEAFQDQNCAVLPSHRQTTWLSCNIQRHPIL